MKKISILLTLILLSIPISKGEAKTVFLRAWVDKLRMRSAPNFSSSTIYVLKEGERVKPTGTYNSKKFKRTLRGITYNGNFIEVETLNGKTGWVYLPALTPLNLMAGEYKLKWKYKTGLTVFRTTLQYYKNRVYIPSNGKSLSSIKDTDDGLYILNAENGKLKKFIFSGYGDSDTTGLAIHNDKIFFGNDLGILCCYNYTGQKKYWSVKLDGDIEGAVSLSDCNNDGEVDVIAATESNSVYAVSGKNGKILWKFHDNRKSFFSNYGFYASPALCDLNSDGINDVVIGSRNSLFYGINGKNGELIWTIAGQVEETQVSPYGAYGKHYYGPYVKDANNAGIVSGIHSSAFINQNNGNLEIIISESYWNLYKISSSGEVKQKINLKNYSGIFSSPVMYKDKYYFGSSWWNEKNYFYIIDNERQQSHKISKISATAVIADILDNGKYEVIVPTETGELLIMNEYGGILSVIKIPSGAEATPLICDCDGDGKLEIIISCLDGYTYCYDTSSRGGVYWGQFRGNLKNSGFLKE